MKSQRLLVRLSEEEKAMLDFICKQENRKLSEQIVHFVRTKYQELLSTIGGVVVRTKGDPLYVQRAPVVHTNAESPVVSLGVKQPLSLKTLQTSTSTETSTSTSARTREAKPYVLPDPKTDPIACLVISFKTLKGVAHDDRSWDKIHFARVAAAAKKLLEVCGDLKTADRCLTAVARNLQEKGFPWSFETILRNAHEWLARERKPHDGTDYRKRLSDQYFEQRSAKGLTRMGEDATDGKILNRFRDLPAVPSDAKTHNGRGDERHERALGEVGTGALEKADDRREDGAAAVDDSGVVGVGGVRPGELPGTSDSDARRRDIHS